MRTIIACAALLSAVVVASAALAATASVSLTQAGPQPASVTVDWGDTVSFSNADGAVHRVVIPRLGVSSPDIPPGGAFELPFVVRAGTYPFRQQEGKVFTGEVIVRVTGTLTLSANRTTIRFGQSVRLTGRSTQPGARVTIQELPFGTAGDWKDARELSPEAGGAFATTFKPTAGTKYRALAAGDQIRSDQVTVTIQPRVRIAVTPKRTKAGELVTVTGRVTPAAAARVASLELYDARRNAWRIISNRALGKNGLAVFKWKALAGRQRLRVAVRRGEVSSGYAASASPIVTVTVVAPPKKPSPRQ